MFNKKKILIVSPLNLPVPSVKGGAVESLLEKIIEENEKASNFDITVVSIFDEEAVKISLKYKQTKFIWFRDNFILSLFDKILNFFIIKVFKKSGNGSYLKKLSFNKKINKLLLKNSFDKVILENNGFLTQIYKGKIKDQYETKLYYHIHNVVPESVNKDFLLKEKVIAVSNFLIENGKERFGDRYFSNAFVLKNCIDTTIRYLNRNERKEFRTNLNLKENDIVILFVGRIAKEKGVTELLDAIDAVNYDKLKLLLVGAPEFKKKVKSDYYNEVCKKIKTISKTVISTGFIDNRELWKYYQAADFAVFPCATKEAAGLTIIEAMFNGLSVITTSSGGIPEYFDTNFGKMIEFDENIVRNLKDSIVEIIKEKKYGFFDEKAQRYVLENFNEVKYYKNFAEIMEKE